MEITANNVIQPGARFERWTVLDQYEVKKNEKRWLCRCQCGTERYVSERGLRYGGSKSCGCLRIENAQKTSTHDLEGKVFGDLTVLERAHQRKNGGVWWRCQCSCGAEYEVPGTLLATGRRTHCGGSAHEKQHPFVDISGRRFHRLVALYPTQKRDARGFVVWHCRCDCGNELDISYNNLLYTNTKSCGCIKKEHEMAFNTFLTHVDGTSIDALRSKRIPTNNTTGYKGVYLIHGKYVAKIVFQKKQYLLGTYEKIEDAVTARAEAEEILFDGTADYYAHWKAQAAADPQWAQENPASFEVSREQNGRLRLHCYPKIP